MQPTFASRALFTAAAALGFPLCAAAQTSYLSATGTFTSQEGSKADLHLYFMDAHPKDTTFRTYAWGGGVNAAGDVIAPGGIDSIIEVFNSAGTSLGYNDDIGTGQRDSLLSPSGSGLTFIPQLGGGTHRYNVSAFDFAIGDGHWSADMVRNGTYRLQSVTGTSSILGTLTVGSTISRGAVVQINGQFDIGSGLVINDGGAVDLQSGVLRTTAAALSGSGQIDLYDNAMIVDYLGDSPLATIQSYILAGYNGGSWNGNGIMSSTAATGAGVYGIGLADNASLGLTTFEGQLVDETTILLKYTYSGDTNLDGVVDISDLGNLATNWQAAGSWLGGDTNYSGFIDITDLGALATNWQAGVGSPSGPTFEEALQLLALPGGSVPEPSALLSAALSCLLLRRRSR